MGLFDRFKFKKEGRKDKKFFGRKKQEPSAHPDNVLDMVKEGAGKEQAASKKSAALKTATGNAYRVLIRPEFSEKARMLSGLGKYVFVVHPAANKPEIKTAVEKVYDVHVTGVNVSKFSGKLRRYGRTTGRTRAWKKAIVSLRQGEKIEGLIDNV